MILQALYHLYEYLAEKELAEEPGWTRTKISYALNLDDEGRVSNVFTLKTEEPRGRKTVVVPRVMKAPMPPKRTVGIESAFLSDNSSYILGIDAKGKPARSRECFEACKALHLEVLKDVDTPAARAVKAYFSNWNPETAADNDRLKDYLEDILTGSNLILYYDNHTVVDDPSIREAWQSRYDSGDGEKIRCLVTGEMAKVARIHPPIKGVKGGQSSGTALVSFNAPSFESFDRAQGMNAPMGERAAFAYTTALNYLIADRDHQRVIGDTTIVMWAESGETAYQEIGMAGFFLDDEAYLSGDAAQAAIVGAVDRLTCGEAVDWDGIRIDPNMRYYIFGFSPNAARLSVRFFLQNSFGKFMQASAAHQKRLEIARPSFDRYEVLSLWRMLQETVNLNSRDKEPPKELVGDTLRAIFTGGRYPATLLSQTQLRILAESNVTRGRAAIIKAYHLRNGGLPMEVLKVKLNRDSDYLPYVLGRLFSVLEQTQEKANDTATIQDRYFNSAAATPAVIFPRLISLAKNHLAKLDDGNRIHYEKQIQALLNLIHESLPARMTQSERGAFQLGYYHEQQYRYTKKEDREEQQK